MKTVISTKVINGETYNLVHRVGDTSSLFFESVESYIMTDEGEEAKSSSSDWVVSDDCFYKKEIQVSMHNNDNLEEKLKDVDAAIEAHINPSIESFF